MVRSPEYENLEVLLREQATFLFRSGIPRTLAAIFEDKYLDRSQYHRESIPKVLGSSALGTTTFFVGMESIAENNEKRTRLFFVGKEVGEALETAPNTNITIESLELIRDMYYDLKALVDSGAPYDLEMGRVTE